MKNIYKTIYIYKELLDSRHRTEVIIELYIYIYKVERKGQLSPERKKGILWISDRCLSLSFTAYLFTTE